MSIKIINQSLIFFKETKLQYSDIPMVKIKTFKNNSIL